MTDPASDSDLIPAEALVKRGGHPYRAMGPEALRPRELSRRPSLTCSQCEKWDARRLWCKIRACVVQGFVAMCRYGIVLRAARLRREKWRKRGS